MCRYDIFQNMLLSRKRILVEKALRDDVFCTHVLVSMHVILYMYRNLFSSRMRNGYWGQPFIFFPPSVLLMSNCLKFRIGAPMSILTLLLSCPLCVSASALPPVGKKPPGLQMLSLTASPKPSCLRSKPFVNNEQAGLSGISFLTFILWNLLQWQGG